jgi:hypothetical protein
MTIFVMAAVSAQHSVSAFANEWLRRRSLGTFLPPKILSGGTHFVSDCDHRRTSEAGIPMTDAEIHKTDGIWTIRAPYLWVIEGPLEA